ncbi:hypothetical protein DC31_06500 [Microbacterium sp. CH12i]|uniref:hypothetical protein n=1 Tax=Microbacterium sp. CH12i TaxID=1479651 RepID=UPI000460BEB3|nr:hypothetical protein [Microbacterium sp. CH12i]KDA04523.1 hypothetical protein DC31_06500 [Microbacterium sp. CH12i]
MTVEPVEVTYHHEEGTWWAESDQMPGFSAWGKVLSSVQASVAEEFSDRFDSSARPLVERDDSGTVLLRRPSSVRSGPIA